MRLLHFRRTFVEKMFAIHGKVEIFKRDGRPIGGYARHYYDLHQLAGEAEVRTMLQTAEYAAIRADYDIISRAHFARDYAHPAGMSFATSDALFPPSSLASALEGDYIDQCNALCFGAFPSWTDVRARFDELRPLL